MSELTQAAGGGDSIRSPAKIGLVRTSGGEVCLIDSGSDRDAAKKVKRLPRQA